MTKKKKWQNSFWEVNNHLTDSSHIPIGAWFIFVNLIFSTFEFIGIRFF